MPTKIFLTTLLAATALAGANASVVIDFDDLSGFSTVPTLYKGVDWQGNFVFYDSAQNPYNPHSGATRIFADYGKFPLNNTGPFTFKVGANSVFDGFWTAGAGQGTIGFSVYQGGVLKATSAAIVTTPTPTFLASNYSGLIDEVRITAQNGYWIGDDFTFAKLNGVGGTVPEPASWALMIVGFGLVGAAARRRTAALAA